MKATLFLSLAALAAIIHAATGESAAENAARRAEVTLPFADIRALLEANKAIEPPPPIAAVVSSARLTLALGATPPVARAEFDVEVLAEGWQLVPLLHTPFHLTAVAPAEATVAPRNNFLCLLVRRPGRTHLILTFEIPSALAKSGADAFPLLFGAATAGRLEVESLPDGCRVEIRCGTFQSGSGGMPLPPNGGEITVRLIDDKPLVPTTWRSDIQTLLVTHDDRLVVESRLHLVGDSGSGVEAQVALPSDAIHTEFSGLDLRPVRLGNNASDRLAELTWDTPDQLSRDVILRYELPRPDNGNPWVVQPPRPASAPLANARTIVVGPPGFELSAPGAQKVDDASSLPPWMTAARKGNSAIEMKAIQPFVVTVRALPHLEVDTARISEARYQSRTVSDGSRLCEARFRLQHHGPLRWRFSLPKGSELLSCEVAGHATNPLILDRGELGLILPSSDPGQKTSEVTFSYIERGAAFAPVEGKLSVTLPSTPLFTENLLWSLTLPDAYEATAFEGNVEPKGGGSEIHFQKRLVRNEAATVEIYYRKRDTIR